MRARHPRTAAPFVLALFFGATTFPCSISGQQKTEDDYNAFSKNVVHTVVPRYPWIARVKGHDGYGLYKLNIDMETGLVVSVDVVKTSTHQELDDCAIKAFRQWRFRPHTWHAVNVPATFTYDHQKISEARRLAVYAPDPPQPSTRHHGRGTFRFIVDYDTGKVTAVQIMQSTGRPSFDQDVVKTYRKWRFVPHKVRTIDTVVGFGG